MSTLDRMSSEEKQQLIDEHNRTHLIKFITHTDTMVMDDLLLTMAKNVEAALKEGGAEPGKDYTYQDLFTMALPFALEVWKKNPDKMTFATMDF